MNVKYLIKLQYCSSMQYAVVRDHDKLAAYNAEKLIIM